MKITLPMVVIVGRTNVGKSTLFNRLSVDVKSLTLEYEGVTRDFLKDTVCWQDSCFELIDTGGISLRKTDDSIMHEARQRALALLQQADLILFVCDGKVGVVPEDREIAKLLHKAGKKTFLVVNKIDTVAAQERVYEFERLGFKLVLPLSAQHGTGIADLLEGIVNVLPAKKEVEEVEPQCRVVILGKPNVGKSSLMNLLVKQERAIVADIPGTTREAITERVRFYQEDIQITDTPGLRRKRAVTEPIELLMTRSALRTVNDTDLVLLVLDATQGKIADQELKLAFYAFEKKHKALIMLFNKEDLLDEQTKTDFEFSLEEYDFFIKNINHMYISCETEKNVGRVMPLVQKVWQRYSQSFSDEEITLLFKEALQRKPLYRAQHLLNVYSARQVRVAPITILLRVNYPQWFGPSQLGFFENILRRAYNLKSVPIKFVVRKRGK